MTVTIPYYRCREHVAEAVESVLAQTHRDLTLVVVNDGDPQAPWDRLAHIDDERLVRFDLEENRGRYYADAVVLGATADKYLMVHDADDWSEPTRLARLLVAIRREHAVASVSAVYREHGPASAAGNRSVIRFPAANRPVTGKFTHPAPLFSLFDVAAAQRIGGFYGGFRIGYDTFFMLALLMVGRVACVDEPLYHWRSRKGSLTRSPATGHRSSARASTTRQLRDLYLRAYASYTDYLAGAISVEELATGISRLARTHTEVATLRRLDADIDRLRGQLVEPGTPPSTGRPKRTTPASAIRDVGDVYELVEDRRLQWGPWTIGKAVAVELAERLERRRPRRVLEAGSGISTAVLASYALRHGAEVTSLEHEPRFAQQTRQLLASLGLQNGARVVDAPLQPLRCGNGQRYPWYGQMPAGPFDFFLIDGPPSAVGRQAAFFAIAPTRTENWEVWLDDGRRDHERACLDLWRQHFRFTATLREIDERGQYILTPTSDTAHDTPPPAAPPGVGIAMLAGGRADLAQRALQSLRECASNVWSAAHVVVLVNSGAADPGGDVGGLQSVDRVIRHAGAALTVGQALSRLIGEVAGQDGIEYVLHLDEAWVACTADPGWFERAWRILADDASVGQVRLRHCSERVLRRHMLTGRPITWSAHEGYLRSPAAHFTFNPSLLRARTAAAIFPARDEGEAQRRFLRAGLASVQLRPGVFRRAARASGEVT